MSKTKQAEKTREQVRELAVEFTKLNLRLVNDLKTIPVHEINPQLLGEIRNNMNTLAWLTEEKPVTAGNCSSNTIY